MVLCDRFIDSSRVYQGVTGNLDSTYMAAVERIAIDGAMPDMTIILDIPAEKGCCALESGGAAKLPIGLRRKTSRFTKHGARLSSL